MSARVTPCKKGNIYLYVFKVKTNLMFSEKVNPNNESESGPLQMGIISLYDFKVKTKLMLEGWCHKGSREVSEKTCLEYLRAYQND